MASVDLFIYIIIGLLGLAYPILLQVIARLDEKYESEYIAELFKNEFEWTAFRYTLVASLIFAFIWSMKLESLIDIEFLNWLIDISAIIPVAVCTILLVISFFFFAHKVLIYYNPYDLIPYLIERYEMSGSKDVYYLALSEILLLTIRRQQTNLSRSLSNFFYKAFRKIREKFTSQPVEYPYTFYEIVYRAIEELAIQKEKRNYLLEKHTAGSIWLLGEIQVKQQISELTYSCLWGNLKLAIKYHQDDFIIYHWETCHQYYSYNLPYIHPDYTYSANTYQVSNQEVVDKRLAERERFIDFHYALGGLLLYTGRYSCLKRLFSYTQNEPPKYELLPESMDEIFKVYFNLKDPYETKYPWITHLYPFPEMSGLNADYGIKKWIMSYMALLFLRQYTIVPYLITMQPLNYPQIPETQGEIKQWSDGLDFFKKLVSEHLENSELIKKLNLDFITEKWCVDNNKPHPYTFIETFKTQLDTAYNVNAMTLPISETKTSQFENSTKEIVETTYSNLLSITNENPILDEETDKWYVTGNKMLQSRDAFIDIPEAHHINFDTFLATAVSKRMLNALVETFLYKKTRSYFLQPDDLFKAVDRLAIDDNFSIINFGINLDHYINDVKVQGLSLAKYKRTDIRSLVGNSLVNDSIFILRKTDLPRFLTMAITPDIIEKYSLRKISETINLYASVIDLNSTSPIIFDENKQQDRSEDEMRKSVLLNIIISVEIKWKKVIEVIHLRQNWKFPPKGTVSKIDDVEPFRK
jgi:hypothetical protein